MGGLPAYSFYNVCVSVVIAIDANTLSFCTPQMPGDKMGIKVSATDRQEIKSMLKDAVAIQQERMIRKKPEEKPQAKNARPSSSSFNCVECCTVT